MLLESASWLHSENFRLEKFSLEWFLLDQHEKVVSQWWIGQEHDMYPRELTVLISIPKSPNDKCRSDFRNLVQDILECDHFVYPCFENLILAQVDGRCKWNLSIDNLCYEFI